MNIKFEDFYFACGCPVYDEETGKQICSETAMKYSNLEIERFSVNRGNCGISVKFYKDDLEEE